MLGLLRKPMCLVCVTTVRNIFETNRHCRTVGSVTLTVFATNLEKVESYWPLYALEDVIELLPND